MADRPRQHPMPDGNSVAVGQGAGGQGPAGGTDRRGKGRVWAVLCVFSSLDGPHFVRDRGMHVRWPETLSAVLRPHDLQITGAVCAGPDDLTCQ